MDARLGQKFPSSPFLHSAQDLVYCAPETRLEVKRNCVFVEVLHFVPGPKSIERRLNFTSEEESSVVRPHGARSIRPREDFRRVGAQNTPRPPEDSGVTWLVTDTRAKTPASVPAS